MSTRKKNTPTGLKKLAEASARVAGELESYRSIQQAHLETVSVLKERLRAALEDFDQSSQKFTKLTADLVKIDKAIVAIAPIVNPASIQPINASLGRYGRRGGLRDFVFKALAPGRYRPDLQIQLSNARCFL